MPALSPPLEGRAVVGLHLQDIEHKFGQYGKVLDVRIVREPNTGALVGGSAGVEGGEGGG